MAPDNQKRELIFKNTNFKKLYKLTVDIKLKIIVVGLKQKLTVFGFWFSLPSASLIQRYNTEESI